MADSSSDNKNTNPPPTATHAPVTGYPPPPSYAYAAYPYPAPPPPPYPAYPYQQQPPPPPPYPQQTRSNTFIRRLFLLLIGVFVILGAITLIFWLVLRPQLPRVAVSSASVAPFNLSSSSLSANWDLSFRVENPNGKMSVSYDRIVASVFFNWAQLAETSIPPMYQGKHNSTAITARLAAVSEYVANGNGLAAERGSGVVKFDVRLVALVRFQSGAWRTRRRLLRAFCEDVPFTFNASGNGSGQFSGPPRACDVYI